MPLQATSGAASYDAFGGGVAAVPNYIEDVFSTWLYTGNGSTQTITNGIDLSTKGGLVWVKNRSSAGYDHVLTDTSRGAGNVLSSNNTSASQSLSNTLTAFNSTGFTLGSDPYGIINYSGQTYASWTFRKQPKFFDVVTYTGDGSGTGRQISHSLGSTPGCIILKSTSTAGTNWIVYHRSLAANFTLKLQTTEAAISNAWISTVTDTYFTGSGSAMNVSGQTYVAYLFAHDAGGFGLSGTDNVISCGSFTTDSGGSASITLGYEPQWLLAKPSSTTGNWELYDNMRGWTVDGVNDSVLYPNTTDAEATNLDGGGPTATGVSGFTGITGAPNATYIYIAIRRGPMRTPTTGTSVFEPVTTTSSANPLTVTTGFPVDLTIQRWTANGYDSSVLDRLRGGSRTSYARLLTTSTAAEVTGTGAGIGFDSNTTEVDNGWISGTANKKIYWTFRRAPGFMDVCCYTGSGTTTTQSHNLGVVPELIIVKSRSGAANWQVYSATYGRNFYAFLDLTQGFASDPGNAWGTTDPTSTTFSLSPLTETNASGSTYVAYLFASCPGVSKVGSYTGTGTTQTINCGFTGGARFVLIKRTNSTGDWYVWDSARGIVAGNDPYLLLNTTDAEVTNTDYIDTASTGFEISSTAPAAINASGGTFIFLAIA